MDPCHRIQLDPGSAASNHDCIEEGIWAFACQKNLQTPSPFGHVVAARSSAARAYVDHAFVDLVETNHLHSGDGAVRGGAAVPVNLAAFRVFKAAEAPA